MSAVDWESMRLHPYHAERILANVPAFAHVTPLVAAHHERPDGQGYPRGLRGEQLPLGARLLAVAETIQPKDTGALYRQVDCKYAYNLDVSSLSGQGSYTVWVRINNVNLQVPATFDLR